MAVYHYILLLIAAAEVVLAEGESKCECALFQYPTPETTDAKPLASKSPNFQLNCSAEGKSDCLKMCIALVHAGVKEERPHKICEVVKDTTAPFKPMVFYRACDEKVYTDTGIKSDLNICCENQKVITCP